MNKTTSIIKEYNLVFWVSFLILGLSNFIAWSYIIYTFIGTF